MSNFKLPPFTIEDPGSLALSELRSWAANFLRIPAKWQATGGEGVSVAVLDTGVAAHQDLITQGERDFTGEGLDDRNGHGTHCAGVVGARGRYQGIAPFARIHAYKVLRADGSGTDAMLAAGIHHAVDRGIDIISLSLGSPTASSLIGNAIRRAHAAGVWVFAAAGNSGGRGVDYPGAFRETVAVAAFDQSGRLADFSGRGSAVTVAGPGVDILGPWLGGGYRSLSGTSMATPVVAGLAACALGELRAQGVDKPAPERVLQIISQVARDAGPPGRDPGFGYGIVYGDDLKSLIPRAEQPSPEQPADPPPAGDFWSAVRDVHRLAPAGVRAKVVLEVDT